MPQMWTLRLSQVKETGVAATATIKKQATDKEEEEEEEEELTLEFCGCNVNGINFKLGNDGNGAKYSDSP